MNKIRYGILLIVAILASILLLNTLQRQKNNETHIDNLASKQTTESNASKKNDTLPYTATFAIYTNNTFRIFTNAMYHNRSDNVYITADNPNTITVTSDTITWEDFFTTLPFSLSHECLTTGTGETFCSSPSEKLTFVLNGEVTDNILTRPIYRNDRLLVSFGPLEDSNLSDQIETLSNL